MRYSKDLSLMHLFHRASQVSDELFKREAGGGSLTVRQFLILQAISEEEGINQATLVARTGVDRSTMTDLVRKLQQKGLLVRRRRRGDQRSYSLNVTAAGSRVLKSITPVATRVEQRLFIAVPAESQQLLLDTLVKIAIFDWRADR